MKLIIACLLFVTVISQNCYGIDSSNSTVCSSKGVCVSNNLCSCWSGYAGDRCEIEASKTSCVWNTPTATKVDFFPVIDTTTLDYRNDILTFSIFAPIVNNRYNRTIFIQNVSFGQCAFPGTNAVNVLEQSATPCFNKYTFSIPWSTGKDCGWTRTDTESKIIYNANIFIWEKENVGSIRGVPQLRDITRVIPIAVEFQTQVTVSTIVRVFAPVNMLAAVTKQQYIAGPPQSGVFEFITSLQFPFVLDTQSSFSMTKTPTGLTSTISDISDSSQCVANQPCTQKFRIPIGIVSACSFTGDYEASFVLKCHPSITNPANCPLDPANRSVKILFTANSEDFCSVARVEINISGILQSFSDNTYSVQKNSFLMDARAFFKATISSPKATLKTCTLTRVQWSGPVETNVLFDQSLITAEGTRESYATGPSTSTTASFNFLLAPEWMTVPVDSNVDFNVTATIKVTYEAIDGTTRADFVNKIFNIGEIQQSRQGNSQDSKQSSPIGLFGSRARRSNATKSIISIFGLLLILLITIM
jgi:hypothetical protein